MGGIAIALVHAGHRVTGSDDAMYDLMSDGLRRANIHASVRYAETNLPDHVDVVVVGNDVRDDNPELRAAMRRALPLRSFPQFLRDRYLTKSRNAVVAGGVGKTTTAAMLAWILEHAGVGPDYVIGGIPRNLDCSARLTGGRITVIEGDEYTSGAGDHQPKFLHYGPEVAVVTNVIAGHADPYAEAGGQLDAFRKFVRLLPPRGCLILPSGDETAARLVDDARCSVVTTGFDPHADCEITTVALRAEGSDFEVGGTAFTLPLCGRMNIRNAAMAVLAAGRFGVTRARAAEALAEFRGVQHRQDAVEIGDCTMVIDTASHPPSILELCLALRQRYPDRRLVMVIQPRPVGGRGWRFQRELPAALTGFDKVILAGAIGHDPLQDRFSVEAMADDVRQLSGDLLIVPSLGDLPGALADEVQSGDVVVLSLPEQSYSHVATIAAVLTDRDPALELNRTPAPQAP